PAFVSRVFRHGDIYIRTDRGISTPEDLRGRIVGVPEYQMTAALWIRGILSDEYGVKTRTSGGATAASSVPAGESERRFRCLRASSSRPLRPTRRCPGCSPTAKSMR
ncbi:MAG: hypothetical protein ACXU84_23785, partial [Xanthobacteraceae bacterium]